MSVHQYVDDAPFGAPPGVALHYVVTVTSTAQALTAVLNAGTAVAHTVPSYLPTGEPEENRRWPRAVYMGHMDIAADVWITWDGVDPVVGTTTPIGVKVPPTYPALRVPMPAAIKAGTIKLRSGAVGGTPVILTYEF